MGLEIHDGLDLWKPRILNEWERVKVGNYFGGAGSNTSALVANRLYACYLYVPRVITVDRIALTVQEAAAGGHIRMGIYRDADRDFYPDALVLDAGVVTTDATGEKAIVIDQQLSPGIYGLAFVADCTAKLWLSADPRWRCPVGQGTSAGYYHNGWQVAQAYGELPDPFTAGGTGINDEWQIAVRVASMD